MSSLKDFGEYVSSPASKLEEPVLRRLYESLGYEYQPEPLKKPPDWDRKGQSSVPMPHVLIQASEPFNPELTEWHSSSSIAWWDTQDDVMPCMQDASWKLSGFTDVERDAWLAHGLRGGEVRLAVELRDGGLMPADLMIIYKGWSVLRRVKAGESAQDLVRHIAEDRSVGRLTSRTR